MHILLKIIKGLLNFITQGKIYLKPFVMKVGILMMLT